MQVDAARLTHLISALERSGADTTIVNDVLMKSGLRRSDAAPAAKIFPYEKEARFVREACDALNDKTFGARAGLTWQNTSSAVGYIAKYSKDLKAAVANTVRFHAILDPALHYDLRIAGNYASFEVQWKDRVYSKYRRHTEFMLFGILCRMRTITQTNFFPLEMRFDHEVRRSLVDYQKLAGFPVVFGAETLEIILPLSVLDIPIPTYDLRLREHLTAYGERLINEQVPENRSLRSKVEGLLTSALPTRMLPAEEVASDVGMSPRTFGRRLKEEGTSFRQIVDELRLDLAKTCFKDGMTLSEIAYNLGYADHAAFTTAFKRWTGVVPSSFLVMP